MFSVEGKISLACLGAALGVGLVAGCTFVIVPVSAGLQITAGELAYKKPFLQS